MEGQSVENGGSCIKCEKSFDEGGDWVECESCKKWFCRRCAKLISNKAKWGRIQSNKEQWFCVPCVKTMKAKECAKPLKRRRTSRK